MGEVVTLVNDNGQVIGGKTRKEVTDSDICQAVAIWLTDPNKAILIARRSLNLRPNPGLWSCAVEGLVTFGDTLEETAHKELAEELGLHALTLTDTNQEFQHAASYGHRRKHFYKAVVDVVAPKLELQVEEVAEVEWLEPAGLLAKYAQHPEQFVHQFKTFIELSGLERI